MAVLKSQCPECRKILKLKTKAALGKRVPCPQCNKPFIVEEYESPELVDDFIDDGDDEGETFDYAGYEESSGGAAADYDDGYDDGYDDYEDDDYGDDGYDEAPRRKSTSSSSKSGGKSKSKKNKKKKSAGMPAWLPMALMAGAGVAALAGIVGAIIAFMPGGGNQLDLTWLPGDADIYMQIKPQEMWNSKVLEPLRDIPAVKNALNQAGAGVGQLPVDATDVKMVTLAVTGIQQTSNPFQGMSGGPGQTKTLAVIRLSKAVQASDFEALPGFTKQDHNGTSYFSVNGQAMYLADETTIVAGEQALVTAAIDRGPNEPRVSRIDFINPNHQLVMVMSPHVEPTIKASGGNQIEAAFNKNARAAYFGLSLKSDIELEMGVDCFGSAEAAALKSQFDTMLNDAKSRIDAQGAQVPDQMKTFVDIGTRTVKSFSVSTSGSELMVSGSVPGEVSTAVADLAKNPFAAMGLAGMLGQGLGGFGGGASPPGFGGGAPTITPGQTGTTPSPGGSSNPLTGALDAARRTQSKNNLKQLMLGVHNYHDAHKKFPQSAIVGPDGKTTHSWRVALLPFLNQTALYNQYKLDEPWDSPANQSVMNQMPAVFRHPNDLASSTNAAYFGLVGPDTAMGDSTKQTGMRDVTDGTSNTIFLVEAKRNIPWSKPEDVSYATGGPIPQLGGHHNGGYHVGLADGATRFLSASVDQNTLRNLINRKDGQVVGEF
ncbi:MAG: DUF1559 domain-containing protein [Planctomycetota bacterium]|nr:DUF1559 domain-containing protein [Planctomycetota bacterium]